MATRFKRFDPVALRRLEKQRDRIAQEIANLDVLSEGLKGEFWKRVEERIEPQLNRCEKALDGFDALTERQIVIILAERRALRGFLDVKSAVKMREQLDRMLANKREEIETYNERKTSTG